ncbi:MAG: PD-(D/E)XK nuclease-like domain-containing protein, partial [Clostridia bacterium]|nr:PD-(D/E)XK nuclease-like domain-containing protein [Clostridia bacterium]
AAEGVSRSQLWRLKESPEKFKYAEEHPEEPTPALIFGQMVHKLVLEPETFDDEFSIMPEIDRRTKDGKAIWNNFVSGNGEKMLVRQADYETALAMKNALLQNDLVVKLLSGKHEAPLFWTDEMTGEKCKARLDVLTPLSERVIIADYKSTNDASTEAFIRSAINYGYDFQAAMYTEAVRHVMDQDAVFIFIAQEKDPPYAVNVLAADQLLVQRGYDTFRELLGIYHECKVSGNWYGYLGPQNQINVLGLPAYLAKELQ